MDGLGLAEDANVKRKPGSLAGWSDIILPKDNQPDYGITVHNEFGVKFLPGKDYEVSPEGWLRLLPEGCIASDQLIRIGYRGFQAPDQAGSAIAHLEKSYNQKPPVYVDPVDGRTVIRNSKVGACPREIWAYWKGMEPEKMEWAGKQVEPGEINSDPMLEGHLHEAHVKQLLIEAGWKLDGFELEYTLLIGDCKIVGHADMGTAIDPQTGINYLGEVKSMGKDKFAEFIEDGWDLFPTYPVQLSVGMIATGKPGIVWVKNRDNGLILPPFIFHEPPVSRGEIMRKVLMIREMVKQDRMPLCGAWRKTSGVWCKFSQLHDQEEQETVAQEILDPVLVEQFLEYNKLGTTRKVWQVVDGKEVTEATRRAELRKVIDEQLKTLKTREIHAGGKCFKLGEDKLVFDEEKFKQDHPALWLKFRNKESKGQLRVTDLKGGGDGRDGQ